MDISSLIVVGGEGPNRFLVKSIGAHKSQTLIAQQREFNVALGGEGDSEGSDLYVTLKSPTAQKVCLPRSQQIQYAKMGQNETGAWVLTGPSAVLVTKFSATHRRSWENKPEHICGMICTHSDVVKFGPHDHDDRYVCENARASLLLGVARVAVFEGKRDDAEGLCQMTVGIKKRILSTDHPETLTSMANLASTYRNQGLWVEAETLEMQVMETRKKKLGAAHTDTLMSMANLASIYRNQGRWVKAETLEVQVMETRKKKLVAAHPDTLMSMTNLASTFWNQGRWEEAETFNAQAMDTHKAKLGADHPATLTRMANLASTLSNQGRWEEAETLEVQVMETRKMKLGADHPDTLTSMVNLACTWWNAGRGDEATSLMQESIFLREKKFGSSHPLTQACLNILKVWERLGSFK